MMSSSRLDHSVVSCYTGTLFSMKSRNPIISLVSLLVAASTSTALSINRPTKCILDANDGFFYRQGVFACREVNEILRPHLNKLIHQLKPETQNSVAHNRQGISLSNNHALHQFFSKKDNQLTKIVRDVTGNPSMEIARDVPIDIRRYPLKSSMNWHVDDVLYEPAQIEAIWCFRNTSNCETLCRRHHKRIQSVKTEENSVILIKAGGPPHAVTTLTRGERIIVKLAFVDSSKSQPLDSAVVKLFPSTKVTKRKR